MNSFVWSLESGVWGRWFGATVLTCLLLVGCQPARQQPTVLSPVQLQELAHRYAATPAATARLLLSWRPATGAAPATITVDLRLAADGRIRAVLSKASVTVAEALVQGDGTFTAWSPRSRQRTAGSAEDAQDWLRHLALIRRELLTGPLPTGDDPVALPQAELAADGAVRTRNLDSEHQLTYRDEQHFDQVLRPTHVELTGPDGVLRITVREFQPLPGIADERMALVIPAEVEAVAPDAFLDRLE